MNNKKRRKLYNFGNTEKIYFQQQPGFIYSRIGVAKNFSYHVRYGRPCTAHSHDRETLLFKNSASYVGKVDEFWVYISHE